MREQIVVNPPVRKSRIRENRPGQPVPGENFRDFGEGRHAVPFLEAPFETIYYPPETAMGVRYVAELKAYIGTAGEHLIVHGETEKLKSKDGHAAVSFFLPFLSFDGSGDDVARTQRQILKELRRYQTEAGVSGRGAMRGVRSNAEIECRSWTAGPKQNQYSCLFAVAGFLLRCTMRHGEGFGWRSDSDEIGGSSADRCPTEERMGWALLASLQDSADADYTLWEMEEWQREQRAASEETTTSGTEELCRN